MLCGGVSVSLGGAGGARWCAESSGTNERENKDAIHVAGIGEAVMCIGAWQPGVQLPIVVKPHCSPIRQSVSNSLYMNNV